MQPEVGTDSGLEEVQRLINEVKERANVSFELLASWLRARGVSVSTASLYRWASKDGGMNNNTHRLVVDELNTILAELDEPEADE